MELDKSVEEIRQNCRTRADELTEFAVTLCIAQLHAGILFALKECHQNESGIVMKAGDAALINSPTPLTICENTMRASGRIALLVLSLFFIANPSRGGESTMRVLVLVEGKTDLHSFPMGDGRQLATLLGHFRTTTTVRGVEEYAPGMMRKFDQVFYIGFSASHRVPEKFLNDVMRGETPVVWIHTGFAEFSATRKVADRFGFSVSGIDSTGGFTSIESEGKTFTKEEPNINVVTIADPYRVEVLATAVSSTTGKKMPYIVSSGRLMYVADSPFASIGSTDRYLLFADMLHDILGQPHAESHTAILRIEDVNPTESPDRLREIADILSDRGIPFLVGVTPFYVDPGAGLRIGLSDRPEIVDALRYMVRNGGTIVMHGTTHQYKGITAADYEFWDEDANAPIRDEKAEAIARKIEMGIQEFVRNGLYPLAWETPHYTASFTLYKTVARYFSTAIEQRLAIENADYSQFFPYVIEDDLFGQRILPENLGYVPLETDREKSERHVRSLLDAAQVNLQVRDGFASHFFHAFLEPELLEELVDGMEEMGYHYLDLRGMTNRVQLKDRVILTGSQSYSLTLHDQYLRTGQFDSQAEPILDSYSDARLTGTITRPVTLQPGEIFTAGTAEFKEYKPGSWERLWGNVQKLYESVTTPGAEWNEARPVILWNHHATGAAYNDEASLASVFRSVSIPLDSIFLGQRLDLQGHNLVIVPYTIVDSLTDDEHSALVAFVEAGGSLITDAKTPLAYELGFTFGRSTITVNVVSDQLFPEERITWRYPEPLVKFESHDIDEVFCVDNATELPLVVGKRFGKGKILFIGTRFDPYTQLGYTHYPFLMEYVRRYFALGPIVRRDNLEVYFDPGFRRTQSVEDLVKLWVRQGIRRIHVAGWHQYQRYTYDYARLIHLAHANGILVYAWIEPPQVSHKFWKENPQWREKNYKGEDVRPSWRYPVALTDDSCLESAVREYAQLLYRFDFDGANLAELYFEAGKGFEQPQLWTPMHSSAQREVKRLYGFSLPSIFDSSARTFWKANPAIQKTLVAYRVERLQHVYRRVLQSLDYIRGERPGFEIIVTAMDSHGSPELREHIGVDMDSIRSLQREFPFALQVEDPERLWSTSPLRYMDIGREYSTLMGGEQSLMLDLNILGFRSPEVVTGFPTLIPTGTEAFQLVRAAATAAPRLTMYAESSLNPQDMLFLPHAAAARVHYQPHSDRYVFSSPVSFTIKLPREIREVSLDDMHLTPTRDNLYLIPAGTHTIFPSPDATHELSAHQIDPRIMSLSGNLLSVSYGPRLIAFTYESDGRMYISFDREPVSVQVDGVDYAFTALKGNDCYTITLPAGRHGVDVTAGDVFTYGIHFASFWSSTTIALFGTAASFLLIAMYSFWRILRRRQSDNAH
jgi:uncharacterized protein YdaL